MRMPMPMRMKVVMRMVVAIARSVVVDMVMIRIVTMLVMPVQLLRSPSGGTAAADGTHQATSRSRIRISSPRSSCNQWLSQCGQAPWRSDIGTVSPQLRQ